MAGGDTLDFEILGGIAGQFQDLGGEVLQDGGAVHGGRGSHPTAPYIIYKSMFRIRIR